MKFDFTGRHIDVTPALRQHVEDQFAKIEHIFDGKPPTAHVVIEVERGRHRSEVVINWRNEVLAAESSISDMYQSLSRTIGKIEKQARKLKDKVIDKSHKAVKRAVVATPADRADKVATIPRIIESKELRRKPMTIDEAAIELEGESQPFIIFRRSDGGNVAILFRRKDGNFGLAQG